MAVKKTYPQPQLATLVDTPPEGEEWIHEVKFDGYRTLTVIEGKTIRMFTRNGFDWTQKYSALVESLKKLPFKNAILDGEVVVLDEKGVPDFNRLQNTLSRKTPVGLVYYVFDLLSLDGKDLTKEKQMKRKQLLSKFFKKNKVENILYSEHFETEEVRQLFEQMCSMGLEGIVSKNVNARYSSGRNENWLKTKCVKQDEFIIIGYLKGSHHQLGALLLGNFENGELRFAGKVGTGFSKKTKEDLMKNFSKIKSSRPTIAEKLGYENIIWLKPKLVAQIEYLEKTKEKFIRHGSFKGLREDKSPQEIVVHRELKEEAHFLFPEAKITREELAKYYHRAGKLILPYIQQRPLNLYICHGSIKGECYFYRRSEKGKVEGITMTRKPNGHYVMSIQDEAGLRALLKLGTVEIHTWGTHLSHLENPDMIVFDLDADEEVSLAEIRMCARRVKKILQQLNLKSFIKTSGGKGYHIHVPIQPIYSWEQIKSFSQTISRKLEQDFPDLYTSSVSPKKRRAKIYIDFLRNARGATVVAPYSLRSKDYPTIAVPIEWKDLSRIKPDQYKMNDLTKLLKRKDPWLQLPKVKQTIELLS